MNVLFNIALLHNVDLFCLFNIPIIIQGVYKVSYHFPLKHFFINYKQHGHTFRYFEHKLNTFQRDDPANRSTCPSVSL